MPPPRHRLSETARLSPLRDKVYGGLLRIEAVCATAGAIGPARFWGMHVKLSIFAVVASFAVTVASGALAQAVGGNQLCAADAQKFCNDKQGADRRACLRDNVDKVTPVCRESLSPPAGAPPAQAPAAPSARQGGGYSKSGGY